MINLQVAYAESEPLSGAKLEYRIFNKRGASTKIAGNLSVEQNFVKLLLTDSGSDIFNPTRGAGLRQILLRPVSQETYLSRQAEIGQSVVMAETQIIVSQVGANLPVEERLLSADIQSISFDYETDTWSIVIALNMEDGNARRVLLGS